MSTAAVVSNEDNAILQSFFAENVLIINRDFACAVGLNEAIVLAQIRYWIKSNAEHKKQTHYRDGHWWTYNTYKDWQRDNFPFMSVASIRRAIDQLEDLHIVVSTSKYNKRAYDQTKWYTINAPALIAFMRLWYTHMSPPNYANKEESTAAYEAFALDWDKQYSAFKYGQFEITDTGSQTVSPIDEKATAQNEQGGAQSEQTYTREYYREEKKRALSEKNGNGTHLEVTEQHIAQSDTPAPKRKRDPQYDAIAEVFDTDVSGKIVNLQGQLFHSKRVRGEWESMKIHPPMTIDELREWARWERKNMRRYADGQERMPATPEVIARHIEDWRRLRNPSPEPQYAYEPDWTKQRPETPEDPQPWNPLYDKNDPKTWVKKPDFWGQPYKYVLVEDDAPAPEPVDVSSIPF